MNKLFCNTKVMVLLCASLAVMLMTSCRGGVSNDEYEKLQAERDSLLNANGNAGQELASLNQYLESVSECVDSISEQEKLLTISTDMETGRRFSRQEMIQRVRLFGELLSRQRAKIAQLTDSLKGKNGAGNVDRLTSMITYLNEQLNAKEAIVSDLQRQLAQSKTDISKLQTSLTSLHKKAATLSSENMQLDNSLSEQSKKMNEGYFLAANKKTLEDKGILTKGGFLKKSRFDAGAINRSECQKVDMRHFNEVVVNSKKPKLLTPAPASSYTFEDAGSGKKKLVILDTAAFWSLSNVIIIQL